MLLQYNTVKLNLNGLAVLLRFREFRFKKSKDKEKKNSRLDISFGSFNRFGLNVFGLNVLYCILQTLHEPIGNTINSLFNTRVMEVC